MDLLSTTSAAEPLGRNSNQRREQHKQEKDDQLHKQEWRGEEPSPPARELLETALARGIGRTKLVLAGHINHCVEDTLEAGVL